MASKGFLGHTEPAAGVVSLIMAANSLAHTVQFPIMHLRTLNPHVEAILGASPGVVALPRASGGLPHGATQASDAHMCTGISSFAFQGTNAHAILQAAPRINTQTASQVKMQWQQQRRWVLPRAHCLIRQCLSADKHGDITFAVNMQQPNLAFLWEHQVLGRSIFPAAGYAEMALAGLRCLADTTTAVVCLQAVAIPAPLLLAPAGIGGGQTVTCCINTSKQQVSIASVGVSSSSETVHMHSHFGLLPESMTASTAEIPSAALTGLLASLAEEAERCVSGDQSQQQQAAAQGMIAPSVADAQQGSWHHPASFDSFLQLGQLFLPNTPSSTPEGPPSSIHVPAGVDCLSLPCRLDPRQQSYGSCQPSGEPLTCNYALYSSQAQSSCVISGMRAKPLVTHASSKDTAEASNTNAQLLYETVWLAEEELHHSRDGINTSSSNRLQLSEADPAMACANALAVMQSCLTAGPNNMDSMLTLQHGRASHSTAQSANAVAGALRTAAIECTLPATVIKADSSIFSSQQHGMQLSLRQPNGTADAFGRQHSAGISMVSRLLPSRDASTPAAFTMLPQPRGALANLKPAALSASSMTQLQPGQVLLQVHAVGINFRDVLNVLGMYPGDPGAPGADCSGIIQPIVTQGLRIHLLESSCLVKRSFPDMGFVSLKEGQSAAELLTFLSLSLCSVDQAQNHSQKLEGVRLE